MIDARQRMTVNEGELATLEQDAAIGVGETAPALGAIGDDLSDGELAGQRLTLRFEIDAGREAIELAATGIRRAQLSNHLRKVTGRLYRVGNLLASGLNVRLRGFRFGERRLTRRIEQNGNGDLRKGRTRRRQHRLGGRS